jgi:uncharacterized protein YbjQ (UPF0145 family)
LELDDILLSTTSSLEGHEIINYLGIVTEHCLLTQEEVENDENTDVSLNQSDKKDIIKLENYRLGLSERYQELAKELKIKAHKLKGNAIVGINYQLTPLPPNENSLGGTYKLTCSGSVVQIN